MSDKLFRTIVTYEFLSVGRLSNLTLAELADEMIYGSISGKEKDFSEEQLSRIEMAEALIDQGSDPDFLLEND
jgi:hypothetical protein